MSRYIEGGVEPSLDEMLGDPVVKAVMERDGVTDERVRATLWQVRERNRGECHSNAKRAPGAVKSSCGCA